jgi:membrane protease YdiL (CAAX protease family)
MLKSIVGIIVGYLVMALVAFAAYTAAYLGLGADRVFEGDTYALSGVWIGLMIAVTLIAGLLGGLTCAAISKNRTTGLVFAVIVFVLSFIFAVPAIMKDHTPVARTGDVPNLQAMQMAQPPAWLCIINPILAGVGVLMGARMKKNPAV